MQVFLNISSPIQPKIFQSTVVEKKKKTHNNFMKSTLIEQKELQI